MRRLYDEGPEPQWVRVPGGAEWHHRPDGSGDRYAAFAPPRVRCGATLDPYNLELEPDRGCDPAGAVCRTCKDLLIAELRARRDNPKPQETVMPVPDQIRIKQPDGREVWIVTEGVACVDRRGEGIDPSLTTIYFVGGGYVGLHLSADDYSTLLFKLGWKSPAAPGSTEEP